MGKDVRVTYKRRHAYATKSNRRQIIRTPGTRCSVVSVGVCWWCCLLGPALLLVACLEAGVHL